MKISDSLVVEEHYETVEEFCDRTGYTEVFRNDGRYWGFPPHGVMPLPIDAIGHTYTIKWRKNEDKFMPFRISPYLLNISSLPWEFQIIGKENHGQDLICIRTDVYPLAWVYWWTYLRVERSLNLSNTFIIHLLEIWGLAEFDKGSYSSWKDIKILKKFIHH